MIRGWRSAMMFFVLAVVLGIYGGIASDLAIIFGFGWQTLLAAVGVWTVISIFIWSRDVDIRRKEQRHLQSDE